MLRAPATSVNSIATYRKARGLSLRTLGAATRIHYTRLHHAEHGRALSESELARVARVLGVETSVLKGEGEALACQ
jgi:hypothetical protein